METSTEKLLKAKIPCEATGIEVKKAFCTMCTPGEHCGLNVYVKDDKIIKVEGMPEHPYNRGKLCTKGAMTKGYVYSDKRLKTPMRRVGKRGEGKFEPITWDEAYAEIVKQLKGAREKYGPNSVIFATGYTKWYKEYLQRFANAFGSVNYGTDEGCCYKAGGLANMCTVAGGCFPDLRNAKVFLGWASNGAYSTYLNYVNLQAMKARGGKIIIVDTRITPAAQKLADVFLQINPGTDCALALGMAKIIIDNHWEDKEFIENCTFGFDAFRKRVQEYDLERVSKITGLDPNDILQATELYATQGPAACNIPASTLAQEYNGFQTIRAFLCLQGVCGYIDTPGGNLVGAGVTYLGRFAGWNSKERDYLMEQASKLDYTKMIAYDDFPLWSKMCQMYQGMKLPEAIEQQKQPLKVIFGMGVNLMMYPNTERFIKALDNIDFFVNTDVFMTYTNKYADMILPACTAFERGEFKVHPPFFMTYTQPCIQPLYESKSDTDILNDLAILMDIDDDLLKQGYEAMIDYMMDGCGLTVADMKKTPGVPIKVPNARMVPPGMMREKGFFMMPSKKFEFYAQKIAFLKDPRLDPLPSYVDPFGYKHADDYLEKYPFILCSGTRIPNTIHTRLHGVSWSRYIRKEPMIEIHVEDAERLGISDGEIVEIYTDIGAVQGKALVTCKVHRGVVEMAHGYPEANSSKLFNDSHLDPYSGYPNYKASRCNIRKLQQESGKAW